MRRFLHLFGIHDWLRKVYVYTETRSRTCLVCNAVDYMPLPSYRNPRPKWIRKGR